MSIPAILNNKKALLAFCVVGCALNYIAYYPGFMNLDSVYQYGQVVTGKYDDWHAPILAVLWRVLDKVVRGPQLMLLFQLLCLWASTYLLLITINNRLWRVLIVLFTFAPVVQNFAGCIIKDTEMAFCWLLAFSIMFRAMIADRKMNIAEAVLSFLFLTYGVWVRPNALPGSLPLCFLWVSVVISGQSGLKKVGLTAAMLIVIMCGQWIAINKFIKPEKRYAENKLFLQDLTGVFVKTGRDVFPQMLYRNPYFDTAYLRAQYHPATFDHIWWNKDFSVTVIPFPGMFSKTAPKIIPNDTGLGSGNNRVGAPGEQAVSGSLASTDSLPGLADIRQALFKAWERTILAYPGVYLRNRFDGFLYYLRIRKRNNEFINYFIGIVPNDFGFSFHRNPISDVFVKPIVVQRSMPYMTPWFWFFLNIILLVFIPFINGSAASAGYKALTWSGIFYALPSFFVFQLDTDFRYFYWNCVACCLAVIVLAYWIVTKKKDIDIP